MLKYSLKRLLLMIPVMLGAIALVFTIMYFSPGDPATTILGEGAETAAIEALREKMGLNDPYIVRLGRYILDVARGDFGESYVSGIPIIQEFKNRVPNTLKLNLVGIILGFGIGIPLGVTAAVNQNKLVDHGSMVFALAGECLPGFWVALMLVVLFSVKLNWLPPFGFGPELKYWIMPILSISIGSFASETRQTRSSMLDVLYSDYIIMARSKGLSEREVVYKHALPNALIPLITMLGSQLGHALGGGLIIETVFLIPGIGYYLAQAVSNRDYIVIQGCVVILGLVFALMMLVTDLIMALVDPRIKAQFAGGKKKKKEVKAHG